MSEKATNVLLGQKEISIFRTSIVDKENITRVKSILNLLIGENQWNFDFEDVDNILRINANTVINGFLIQELKKMGVECEELF